MIVSQSEGKEQWEAAEAGGGLDRDHVPAGWETRHGGATERWDLRKRFVNVNTKHQILYTNTTEKFTLY